MVQARLEYLEDFVWYLVFHVGEIILLRISAESKTAPAQNHCGMFVWSGNDLDDYTRVRFMRYEIPFG